MIFEIPAHHTVFSECLPQFIELIGRHRWDRQVQIYNTEAKTSPFLWKVVADYHWLEVCLGFQQGSLQRTGSVLSEEFSELDIVALTFAASVVRIHERLYPAEQRQTVGRLRDSLKSSSGFAPIFLEVMTAVQMIKWGYDVSFPDLDGSGSHDLSFEKDGVRGEIECKSLTADAGRQVHRRDFWRLMELVRQSLEAAVTRERTVVVVTMEGRLLPKEAELRRIAEAIEGALDTDPTAQLQYQGFRIDRQRYEHCLADAPIEDASGFWEHCQSVFGANAHIAGAVSEETGCLIVVRSDREDDTSKPWLAAMRKGAAQLSGQKAGFLVVQFQDIEPRDLLKFHFRRRAAILSAAVVGHYEHRHVNAVVVQGYQTHSITPNEVGVFGFSILSPEPTYPLPVGTPEPLLSSVPTEAFAAAMGEPTPEEDITYISADRLYDGQ